MSFRDTRSARLVDESVNLWPGQRVRSWRHRTCCLSEVSGLQQTRDTVSQLGRALTSRAEIDQAKGAMMAIHGCTADEAFERLVGESQDHNTKLHETRAACWRGFGGLRIEPKSRNSAIVGVPAETGDSRRLIGYDRWSW